MTKRFYVMAFGEDCDVVDSYTERTVETFASIDIQAARDLRDILNSGGRTFEGYSYVLSPR